MANEKEDLYIDSEKSKLKIFNYDAPTSLVLMMDDTTWAQVDANGKVVFVDLEKARKVTEGNLISYSVAKLVLEVYEMGKQEGKRNVSSL